MTLIHFLLYLAIGRLLIWLLQINGLIRRLWTMHPLLEELQSCDLCLGFWIYLGLALLWQGEAFKLWPWEVERIILAATAALMAHLLRLGWQSKFGAMIIK